MSTEWAHFESDDDFSFGIRFTPDPDQGTGATPEMSASWGSFQLIVAGENLCAHHEEGVRLESVSWYLLPLLDWLTTNWDTLLHEEKLPIRLPPLVEAGDGWAAMSETGLAPRGLGEEQGQAWEEAWSAWWQRHALRAGRAGGLFPDAILRRLGDHIEVSWGPSPLAGAPSHYRFVSSRGVAIAPPVRVATVLHRVLTHAARHLREQLPESNVLQSLVERIDALAVGEHPAREALLAGFGWRLDDLVARWRSVTERFSNIQPDIAAALFHGEVTPLVVKGAPQAALMFGSVAPEIEDEDVTRLVRELVSSYSGDLGGQSALDTLLVDEPAPAAAEIATNRGYDLAEEILDEILPDLDEHEFVDIESILVDMGVVIRDIALRDSSIRAVSIAGAKYRSTILINRTFARNRLQAARRFTIAHELCHLLLDRQYGARLAIASGPWAPRGVERRANAFAAMLLMPPSLVRKAIAAATSPVETPDGVRSVARRLRTSTDATIEHLANLAFIDDAARESLRAELSFSRR